ncbi:ABC transporter permease [Bosea sp. NBC_00550]|uniref:ABC transporter permease n=1 Tax=Bosea sp. NBC_00550 TaxID=2969621 RepID=UPI00222F0D75|nr:ABC transporter permease [Bosea sp. NBC_00550]UZF91298.1 ABC transporter permease [Bosea sp. NBC_00550]
MSSPDLTLPSFAHSIIRHRQLIWRLVVREVTARFQGSVLGVAWMILTPLLTAAMYTFVFSTVFRTRWGVEQTGPFDFAILLLVGTAVHGVFAEAVARAPGLIVSHPTYVTKVVFPIEILPIVAVLSSLVNAGITIAIVLIGQMLLKGVFNWTFVLFPIVLLPFLIFVLALVMLFSACGVFLRDLSQVVGLLVTFSLFLTPIFYPLSAVPEPFRTVMRLNPLTSIVEQSRTVVVFGGLPDLFSLSIYMCLALVSLAASFWLFQRLRPGFADVL